MLGAIKYSVGSSGNKVYMEGKDLNQNPDNTPGYGYNVIKINKNTNYNNNTINIDKSDNENNNNNNNNSINIDICSQNKINTPAFTLQNQSNTKQTIMSKNVIECYESENDTNNTCTINAHVNANAKDIDIEGNNNNNNNNKNNNNTNIGNNYNNQSIKCMATKSKSDKSPNDKIFSSIGAKNYLNNQNSDNFYISNSNTTSLEDQKNHSVLQENQISNTNLNKQNKNKNQNIEEEKKNNTDNAKKVVGPFLSKHMAQKVYGEEVGTRRHFCYRHNPELQCRRVSDGTILESVQNELGKLPKNDQEAITHVWSVYSAAPPQQRNLILKGILAQCCSSQLSSASLLLKDLSRVDFISLLPAEISIKILCYLDAASLCKATQVSRKWHKLADDDSVWFHMCEQHIDRKCTKCGWGLPLLERRLVRAARAKSLVKNPKETNTFNSTSPVSSSSSTTSTSELSCQSTSVNKRKHEETIGDHEPVGNSVNKRSALDKSSSVHNNDSENLISSNINTTKESVQPKLSPPPANTTRRTRPWKEVYSERSVVERNWRMARYKKKEWKGHSDGIMCFQFDGKYLITGSYDAKVKVWNVETNELLNTLTGHISGVRALVFDRHKLITGSIDRTIRIWNYISGECLAVLRGHSEGILSLDFDGKLTVSGSADCTIKVWNYSDKSCFSLRGHKDWVNSVKLHSNSATLFSASDDMTVRMWDLVSRTCIGVFGGESIEEAHVGQITKVLPAFIPISTYDKAYKSEEDIQHDCLYSGDENGIKNGATQQLLNAASSLFTPVMDNEQFRTERAKLRPTHIITSSLDSTIKIWNVETQKCVKTLFGHIEGIWGLGIDTFRIVSGGHDRSVKVWDIETGNYLFALSGHTSPVTCVGLDDSRIVSTSEDGEIRIYDFKDVQ